MDNITKINTTNPTERQLHELKELLANDQGLLYNQIQDIQTHINVLHNRCLNHNMQVNIDKTEVMIISNIPSSS